MPEFFQDQTKQNPISAISSGATIIQNKQDAIKKISKALLEHMNGKPCTWSEAATVIGGVITTEQKKQFFGKKKFTRAMAEELLRDYISITYRTGKDAIVEPAN